MNRAVVISGLLLTLLFSSTKLRADVKDISINVKGVTCPACTNIINMGLRKLAGVKCVKMSLATRVKVEVTPHPGAWIDPARMLSQISQVGFSPEPDNVALRLQGDVTLSGTQLVLTLSDVSPGPVIFVLAPAPQSGKRGDEITQAMDTLTNAVKTSVHGGSHVEVEGRWRPATGAYQPASILVTRVEILL